MGHVEVRSKGADYCTSENKCGRCMGDCDSDADCQDGLKCKQRTSKTDNVPGCEGWLYKQTDGHDWDYCYDPNWNPTDHAGTGGTPTLQTCGTSSPRAHLLCTQPWLADPL